jgi:hypothetical protein
VRTCSAKRRAACHIALQLVDNKQQVRRWRSSSADDQAFEKLHAPDFAARAAVDAQHPLSSAAAAAAAVSAACKSSIL